jgi:hypothetical protein
MPERSFGPRGLSRRHFMLAAGGAGVAAAVSVAWPEGYSAAAAVAGSGTTPDQIHLTWGADPSSEMTVASRPAARRS